MVGADSVPKKLGNEAYVLPLTFKVNWPSEASSSYTLDVKGTCDITDLGINNVNDHNFQVLYNRIGSSGQTNGQFVSLETPSPIVMLDGNNLKVTFMAASATGNVNGKSTGYIYAMAASVIITHKES